MILQENENILVSACGDGSIKVWDVQAPPQANPLRSFEEHTREVSCIILVFNCQLLTLLCQGHARIGANRHKKVDGLLQITLAVA